MKRLALALVVVAVAACRGREHPGATAGTRSPGPTPTAAPKADSKPTTPRGDTTFDMKKKSGGKSSLGTLGSY